MALKIAEVGVFFLQKRKKLTKVTKFVVAQRFNTHFKSESLFNLCRTLP